MATVSSGLKGRLALLVEEASQQQFLVDTGSSYSTNPSSLLLGHVFAQLTAR